jgi:Zn-dependent oligopeptidase
VINAIKKEQLNLDPEETRQYFPYDHVFSVLTDLVKKLFGITFTKLSYVMWDKSVHVYEVTDKDKSIIGYLALDLYPREGKYGHAAMFDFQYGRELAYGSEEYVPPFGAIVANYASPNKKHPSLLSAWEVEALFHEMGHSLHLLLSKVPHKSISGTSVAWDFVETPSQIMENWVYEDEILKKLSKHYITGKPMPQVMRNKIVESRTFLQSMGYLDQIFMGELDMEMHSGKTFDINKRYRDFKKKQYGFTLPADKYLFPAGFGHLGGGYDAAYYSYLWSLVLAQDAFSEFRKKGVTNSEVGMKWRREVLEKGSSDNEMKLLESFLGRKTNQKAFLEELGIK